MYCSVAYKYDFWLTTDHWLDFFIYNLLFPTNVIYTSLVILSEPFQTSISYIFNYIYIFLRIVLLCIIFLTVYI